jgi:hypothetical protein
MVLISTSWLNETDLLWPFFFDAGESLEGLAGLSGEVIDRARALLAENEGGVGRVSLTAGLGGVIGSPSSPSRGGGVTGRIFVRAISTDQSYLKR